MVCDRTAKSISPATVETMKGQLPAERPDADLVQQGTGIAAPRGQNELPNLAETRRIQGQP